MTRSSPAAPQAPLSREAQQQQDQALLDRLLGQGIKLPPQPRVVEQLQRQIQGPEADLRAIARTIAQDAGITALLFKAVQSSAYRQHQPFSSLDKILQAVGLSQTLHLVQAVALAGSQRVTRRRKAYERFWSRSQDVARLAMLIAGDKVAVCNVFPDQAYLAGIFHDCGVPLLLERFPTYGEAMGLEGDQGWIDYREEDRRFQADHCVVGYFIARHWGLPDFIADAIRFHHDLPRLVAGESRSLAAILQLAMHAYHQEHRLDDPEWPLLRGEVGEELGLAPEEEQEYVEELLYRFQTDGE